MCAQRWDSVRAHFCYMNVIWKNPRPETLTAGKQLPSLTCKKEIKHIDHSLYARVNRTVTTPAAQPSKSTAIVYILLSDNLDIYQDGEKLAVSRPDMMSL